MSYIILKYQIIFLFRGKYKSTWAKDGQLINDNLFKLMN